MIVSVVIDDFVERRQIVIFIDNVDMKLISDNWTKSDFLLESLQNNEYFAGRTCWSDLSISHWRIMLIQNFRMFAELNEEERADRTHMVVKSLCFLLSGLITCIQISSSLQISLLRVFRVKEDEITYDVSASLPVEIETPTTNKVSSFKVVVDNTNE